MMLTYLWDKKQTLCFTGLQVTVFSLCLCGSLGPYLGIRGFHHTMLKFCSMHCVNLGLLYVSNGASLKLGILLVLCSCQFLGDAAALPENLI